MVPENEQLHKQDQIDNQENKPKQQQQEIQVKSLNHESLFHTYIQRYYTTYQSKNQFVHLHTNGLFIIRPKLSALPSAPIKVQQLLEPVEVKGKKKRGGIRVKPNTYIAKIHCQDGKFIKVTACVQGTAIEYNENIQVDDLNKDAGYLLIILPSRRFIPEQNNMKKVVYYGNPYNYNQSKIIEGEQKQ